MSSVIDEFSESRGRRQHEMFQLWQTPFFADVQHAETYVASELARILPHDWEIEHAPMSLEWTLQDNSGWTDYQVWVANDLSRLFVTHGNSDAGPFSIDHVLHMGTTIPASALRGYDLSECMAHVMGRYGPNRRGLT